MVFIAVIMVPPILIDGTHPVLKSAGDRLDMMVLCLGNIDDHVRIKQRSWDGTFANDPAIWDLDHPIRCFVASQIYKLGALAFGHGRHTRYLHTFDRRERSA